VAYDVRDNVIGRDEIKRTGEPATVRLTPHTGSEGLLADGSDLDPSAWYHIQLIGQYGKSEPIMMKVYKWEDGKMTFLSEYDNVNERNNSPASYIAVQPNTSIDNVRITKLGADTLTLSTLPAGTIELNAGSGVTMQFSAARNGCSINKPDVEWKVFENNAEINDGSVTINTAGELKTAVDCGDKKITVKEISTEKGNAEGSYD
ncbi:MAG: hypothetical protein ACI4A5_00695, partial [Hominilimicola sp.]